jgi:aminocarboxymuconate-semialdehyde decarboxylase
VQTDNQVNPRNYLGKFWVDSLVHDKSTLQYLREAVSDDKICLGSDYPFPLGERHPGALIEYLQLETAVREKLLYKNALDWLGMK